MFNFRSATQPNQEIGRVFHLSRCNSNMGGKFALYNWSKEGVIHIPKLTKPSGDHLKGKGDGV